MSKIQKQEEKVLEKFEKTKDDKKQEKRRKQAASFLAILMLTFCSIAAIFGKNAFIANAASTNVKVDKGWYTITSESAGTAQYKKPAKKGYVWINIPNTVKIGNKEYKVTSIASNALKGNLNIRETIIGENVTKVGKKAFYGCKYLTSINIRTAKLTKRSIGASAFAGIKEEAMAVVPEGKLPAYKAILKKAGLNGKKQKVKEEKPLKFGPNKPLPSPESVSFSVGDHSDYGTITAEELSTKNSSAYSMDEVVPFTSGLCLHYDIFGKWNTKTAYNHRLICGVCGKCFQTETMLAFEHVFSDCSAVNWLFDENTEHVFTENYFVPDPAPCKAVFRFTIPQGLSYKRLKVVRLGTGEIKESEYHTEVSGQEVSVTIDDIKRPPFYYPFNEQEYFKNQATYYGFEEEAVRSPIYVVLDTVMNRETVLENTVTSSVTYSYKGLEKTVDLGGASVHVAGLKIDNTDEAGNRLDGASFTLYQERASFQEGSMIGVNKLVKVAEGIKPGEAVTGLSIGQMDGENCYRIVQDTFPDGYEETEDMRFKNIEFRVNINTKRGTTVTAEDLDGKKLPVKDGVINITVQNKAKQKTNSGSQPSSTASGVSNGTDKKPENSQPASTPVSNTKKQVKARATYYLDGERESSMTFKQTVGPAETKIDSKCIHDRAYFFTNCSLEKVVLNGAEVDSLPSKVEDGSEIGYFYISQ
ncbi:MAG TPA: hypothetical protein DDY31_06720 [Lachnospiraceae bacterium]|nr:hypothetical protein [Lachnospiraceae bacterium]